MVGQEVGRSAVGGKSAASEETVEAPRPRNVLVAGFEKAVQLFAPVEPAAELREEPIPAAGSMRCGYDFNWELEYLATSTQPFTFSVAKKVAK